MYESFATVWERVADAIPDAPAVVQGDHRVTYGEVEDRAARLAAALAELGVGPDTKVALFLHNCPEYMECLFALSKLRAVPANVNFRYLGDELAQLVENADAEVLVYHRSLRERVAGARDRMPRLRHLVELDDDHAATPPTRSCCARHAPAAADRALGRRPPPLVHRRHHRPAQGRALAPGHPARVRAHRRLRAAGRGAAGLGRPADRRREALARPGHAARVAAHHPARARHRGAPGQHRVRGRRHHRPPGARPHRRRHHLRHHRARAPERARDRRRRAHAPHCARTRRRRRARRALRPVVPPSHPQLGRDGERAAEGRAAVTRDHARVRLARLQRGRRLRRRARRRARARARPRASRSAPTRACSPTATATSPRARARSACSPSTPRARSATTRIPGAARPPSARSGARRTPCRATRRGSRPTARWCSSGAGPTASTRAARRSGPRRSRRC